MRIENLEQLKTASRGRFGRFHIRLIGYVKSRKRIKYDPHGDVFTVDNETDGIRYILTTEQLTNHPRVHIAEAIRRRAFYKD